MHLISYGQMCLQQSSMHSIEQSVATIEPCPLLRPSSAGVPASPTCMCGSLTCSFTTLRDWGLENWGYVVIRLSFWGTLMAQLGTRLMTCELTRFPSLGLPSLGKRPAHV